MKSLRVALLAMAFAGLSICYKPVAVNVNAQSFIESDWSLLAPNGADPWTQKEGDALVNTNSKWFPANFLMNNDTIGLNRTDDGRLSYQVKTKFKSNKTLDELGTAQWRGVVLFYIDGNNWLSASTKWDKGQTGSRGDKIEMSELMVYGRIGGSFYQTWGDSGWTIKEWNDLWADGNQMHLTDETELIVQYTPALNGTQINADTDMVTLIANNEGKSITKTQRLRSLSDTSYFNLDSNIAFMSTGLYSMNVDAATSDSVTFSTFEYSPIRPVFNNYEKETIGYINSTYSLPSVTASTVLEENIAATVTVKDPDGLDVTITNNQFTPTKTGEYTVIFHATDKFNTSSTDSYKVNIVSAHLISHTGELVTTSLVGDEIILPTFFVEDHPEIDVDVNVTDPNGNAVTISNNKFVATINGNYTVRVTSISPDVAPFEYTILVKGVYQIKEDGKRIISGVIGDKITLPNYYIEDHDEIIVKTTLLNPSDEKVVLHSNAFSATKVGTYKVNVATEPGDYVVNEINYEIVISDVIPSDDDTGEETPVIDPNINSYGYGARSNDIYFLFIGIGVGVSSISVGGFFLTRYLISHKRKGK